MPITDAVFYLPISNGMLEAVLDDVEPLERALSNLAIPQVACLVVVQCLPTLAGKQSPTPERMLAQTIQIGNAKALQEGPGAFVVEALRILDREKIRAGYELFADFKILLLTDEDVAFRSYLTAYGNWDYAFCKRLRERNVQRLLHVDFPAGDRRMLTLEQSKVFSEIKGNVDDHLHVQGYAGTGKSFLIKSLLVLLQEKSARTLVLAEHQRQLNALLIGTHGIERMCPRTFGELIREMLPDDLTDPVARRMLRTNFPPEPTPDEEIVRHLRVHPSGPFSSRQIVKAARETVHTFCLSNNEEIAKQHLPRDRVWFEAACREVVLHHATELWQAILEPPVREFQPRVRDHHRVKWAALNGLEIPARYTHILIDECHDVVRPMLQILDRSSQPTFSLGDEYQNLEDHAHKRAVPLRQREVTHSVRSGKRVEDLVNSIVGVHPDSGTALPFRGDPLIRTEVSYYGKAFVPDRPAVVLVSDMWGLFEWSQRLAQSVNFELLSDLHELNVFVIDCIELYRNGITPRHIELFRFTRWEAVAESYHSRRGFERIDNLLRRGYSINDWLRTKAKVVTPGTPGGYALGLIKDVRNREFKSVLIATDVIDWASDTKSVTDFQSASAVYVATTRAQHQLVIPQGLTSWIEKGRAR
jgi:hypothetical protein